MKRIITILLIIVLFITGISAFADYFDLKSLSDHELLALYEDIRAEMSVRGLSSARSLRSGKYVIGKDILSGTYKITCTGTEGEDLGNAYSSLGNAYGSLLGDDWGNLMGSLGNMMGSISETEVKIIGDYGTELKKVAMKTGDVCSITLSEGTALEISDGSILLEME